MKPSVNNTKMGCQLEKPTRLFLARFLFLPLDICAKIKKAFESRKPY